MYPSDLTDGQWAKLEPLLNPPRGDRHAGGRPRKYELRRVVDALLYVVKPAASGDSYRLIFRRG
jgi:transposase